MKYLNPRRNFEPWKINAVGFKTCSFLDALGFFSVKKCKDLHNKTSLVVHVNVRGS